MTDVITLSYASAPAVAAGARALMQTSLSEPQLLAIFGAALFALGWGARRYLLRDRLDDRETVCASQPARLPVANLKASSTAPALRREAVKVA